MPFEAQAPEDYGMRAPGLIPPPTAPEGSLLAAAARQENTIVSAYNYMNERAGRAYDPDHNPLDMIKDTPYEANHLERFVGSVSSGDTAAIMARIDREEHDRKVLEAGGFAGFAAQAAMGILDPTILLPMGTIYRGARVSRAALQSSLSGGASVGAMVAGQEAILYGTQELRTGLESTMNIATGMLVGGLLGASVSYLTSRELAKLTETMDGFRREVNAEMRGHGVWSSANVIWSPPILVALKRAGGVAAEEQVVGSAVRIGDGVYTGIIHADSYGTAMDTLGEAVFDAAADAGRVIDGYITNKGRFLTKDEQASVRLMRNPVSIDDDLTAEIAQLKLALVGSSSETMPPGVGRARSGGAGSSQREGLTLAGALGAEKAGARLSPVTRLQTSPFETSKATIRDLGDAGLSYRENWDGIPTSEGGTVETRIKMRRGPLIEAISATDGAYARYFFDKAEASTVERFTAGVRSGWASVTGQMGGKLSAHEFREEVGKALRRGDEHPIPQVAEAAKAYREHVFDPLKDEAIKLGLLPEDVKTLGAQSYLTRVYNRERIKAQRDRWSGILLSHFTEMRNKGVAKFEEKRGKKVAALETELSDLQTPAAARPALSKQLEVDLDRILTDSPSFAALDQSRKDLRARAAAARKEGRADDAKALLDEEKAAREEAGPDYAQYVSTRNQIAARLSRLKRTAPADEAGAGTSVTGFTTERGSTYKTQPDGTTVRDKAARPDPGHEGQQGIQPQSERTVYVTKEAADELSLFQTQGGPKMAIDFTPDGRIAVKYLDGKDTGKFEARTAVAFETTPKVGLMPVELWKGGTRVHFGNKITDVAESPLSRPARIAALRAEQEIALADFVKGLDESLSAKSRQARIKRFIRDQAKARDQLLSEVSASVRSTSRVADLKELIERTKAQRGNELVEMLPEELPALVDDVTNTILGESVFRLPGMALISGPKGPLRKRILNVPDAAIEDFLESDVEKVGRIYTQSMASDIELAAKFGDVRLENVLKDLTDEFNAKTRIATTDKGRLRLARQFERDKADIGALRDRLRGTYRQPDDPEGIAYRAGRTALNLNYVAKLGGMTISSLADAARPIMRYGLNAFNDGWIPLLTNLNAVKLSAREVRLAGTALDMVRDQRAMELADLLDDFGRNTKFERGAQWAADRFGMLSLMSPWNGGMKSLAGVITMAEVIRATKAVTAGTATKKQIANLAMGGIDEEMAARIWAHAEASGTTVKGVHLPNTEGWRLADGLPDTKVIEAFRAALNREVDTLIVTPGLERPLWMSHPLGRIIGQFKTFAMVSTQRTTIAGLQQRDAAALSGVLFAMGLGAFSAYIKANLRNEDTSQWTRGKWAVEALDNSGILGVLMEVNGISEKVTRGRVGLSAISGKQISRYASRNVAGSLLGPTADAAADLATLGALGSEKWSAADTHALRKIVPLQNLFYVRKLFDKAEQGINNQFNIPAQRPRH